MKDSTEVQLNLFSDPWRLRQGRRAAKTTGSVYNSIGEALAAGSLKLSTVEIEALRVAGKGVVRKTMEPVKKIGFDWGWCVLSASTPPVTWDRLLERVTS